MELKVFKNKRIFIDSVVFIYFIEDNPVYSKIIEEIFNFSMGITSVLTLTECLTLPFKLNRKDLIDSYYEILTESENLEIIEINSIIAFNAAKIRSKYNFRTPDAIQLATGVYANCEAFLTNDFKLKKFKELPVFLLNEIINKEA